MNKINLHNFRSDGSKIFSGRDRGCSARKELQLDCLDKENEPILVSVPKDTWAINSSFFGGLFEASVIALKEKAFKEKYIFMFDDGSELSDELKDNIDEGVYDALNNL